jgi:transposase InsO family protein
VRQLLGDLGLPRTTYYRWRARAATGCLEDDPMLPQHPAILPTPAEVQTVCAFAREHSALGYKRLSYALMAANQAFLRPWMVCDVLSQAQLLGARQAPPVLLRRPPEATHPDQRWHTDLMNWHFSGRWFYLLDVLDAYSRYLVHCELLLVATDDAVTLAVQRALETLDTRHMDEPQIVHDGGPQFISYEWRTFAQTTGMHDVRTHPYHPQSNGRDERLHRTLREELPLDANATLYQAQAILADYRTYYNHRRPHSAIEYLCPHDYYRGDPPTLLAEREAKLRAAAQARQLYWRQPAPERLT